MSHKVEPPSKGQQPATIWLPPSETANIGCASCHDNGPFIRSPYLNQITGRNALPGSDDDSFNSDQPYAFAGGGDFASWKAYKVEAGGNECNDCHRLGVNNVGGAPDTDCTVPGTCGTALDLAERATAADEISEVDGRDAHKNPPSEASPVWMPPSPVQVSTDPAHAAAAKAIHDCAARFHVDPVTHERDGPLPNTGACRITQFAAAYTDTPPPSPAVPDAATIIELIQMPLR